MIRHGPFDALAVLSRRVVTLPSTPRTKRVSDGSLGALAPFDSFESIDCYVQAQLDRLHVPGAAMAIVEGDEIVHVQGFGQARPGGTAPTPHTPFVLGSITKSFTALAIMQLVEAGKVNLDAPVQRYLPWFRVADPQASAQMTVRHLLNQNSGFPQIAGWPTLADVDNRPDAGRRQARALASLKLRHAVGSTFEYSNVNYNLLGLIVEVVSGDSYATYVQRHIFRSLEMRHSYTSRAEARRDGLAAGHRFWFGYPVVAPNFETPSGSLPAAQLFSSAEDMGHYLIAQMNQGQYRGAHILSPAGIAAMHQPVAEVRTMGMSMGRYGMGWFVEERDQARIIWHDGVVPDFFSFMAIVPEQKRGIVLLLNASHFLMQIYGPEVGMGAVTRLAGRPPTPIRLGFLPWVTRALLAVPVLQVLAAVLTLNRLRRAERQAAIDPSRRGTSVRDVLLPNVPSMVLAGLPIALSKSRSASFLSLFAPDITWLARVSGGIAGIWIVVRTVLSLRMGLCSCAPIGVWTHGDGWFHQPQRCQENSRRTATLKLLFWCPVSNARKGER